MVMPIGPLMVEHRLIERMIALMKKQSIRIKEEERVDPGFIDTAVDFIRNYADRLHHGKEEGILFRELENKNLSEEHELLMAELVKEHEWGRKTTRRLVEANMKYKNGDKKSISTVLDCLNELIDFYPRHIQKEDKNFFMPIMEYLSIEEQESMLEEEREFDRNFIHQIYRDRVADLEKG